MSNEPIPIVGVPASPYSRKMRALMRYRHVDYRWIQQGSPEAAELPKPKVSLIPQLILDGEPKTDSTPLIRELERRVPNDRSVIPGDGGLAFLDALLEDFGDEWLTKAMFHYRWAFEADIEKARTVLPRYFGSQQSDEALAAAGQQFGDRQIGRLWVVGSNPETKGLIEASFERILDLLDAHFRHHRFLLGDRPGASDFAFYGQLTQLALFDPTSVATTLRRAPRVYAWVEVGEDLSGLRPEDKDWFERGALPETLRGLFEEVGRVYAPFLLANAEALAMDRDAVSCQIDGRTWTQKPFPYQGKCLKWLRDDYAALSQGDRHYVDEVLAGTGCEALFG